MIPLLKNLLKSEENNIKEKSGSLLSQVSLKLDQKQRGEHILTIMLELSHDDINSNNRVIAIDLLTSLCL